MRIGGLASGMDIDSMVADLMKAERLPMQKMQQDRTWMTWQRDAFREVNTKFLNFRSELTKMKLSTTFRSRMTSTTNENYVSATATSAAGLSSYNISEVKKLATAATKVNGGSVFTDATSVDTRKSLAELFKDKGVSWEQGSVKKETINLDEAKNVVKLNLQDGTTITNPVDTIVDGKVETGNMSVKVGNSYYNVVMDKNASDLASNEVLLDDTSGELTFKENLPKGSDIKVNYTTDYQVDTMKADGERTVFKLSNQDIKKNNITININDTEHTLSMLENQEVGKIMLGNQEVGKINFASGTIEMNEAPEKDTKIEVKYQYDYTSFRAGAHTKDGVKEEAFNIKASQSFDSMISQVNSANVGVSMFYDSVTGQMTLNRTETGNFNGAEYTDENNPGDSEIITKGTFIQDQLNFSGATETGGNDAHFTINGLSTTRSSNSFTISGVTFNLKQTFSGEDVKVNISNDSNTVFENIKGFVEKYNELIGGIQDRLQEDRYKDYRPLTDKQREEMSDKQQELWEEKSKSGLLRRDSTLSSALNDMRRDFYTPVNNGEIPSAMQQLASIGISTTANYLEGGKLEINEAKLKKAIEENPEAVEKLFKNDGTGYGQQGILDRLTDTANKVMDTIKTKAGNTFQTENQYTMGRQLDDLKDRISSFEKRLVQVENRYWRQFTAMEKAIQRANQQSMYLMQQFGGGM
ncbi:flagellar filament capping protein FliD [Virgibacillus halodenitrificans]|uniref:flagellar filament capping protein FliD n=1 Tax=Virgibacillus halodenitrificans TaxID=1482 RepID=UPI00045C8525|nr:flagellar filament capping protein FliD [Virgibacillus halodenitrificans]MCG1026794.1 flagellar filament capping protein FliD [Virgibacillus halodenitrificans]MEC2160583.1 flagellar filament capping protein FliD [Virgibacillus halodenitrificans]CDQ30886.1 Flagellar cap protein [Virgibacillus halodenitrificans]